MTHKGVLLLGPTGSGKTPLGERIETTGLGGQRYCHFDFGAQLRAVVANGRASFAPKELEFLREVLETGALLEDDRFHLAERILRHFLDTRCRDGHAQVVMNGLPRHAGQAEAVGQIVHVHTVVSLQCTEEVVAARIADNVGGDRSGRIDDDAAAIRRKLTIFEERTGPLVEYYRGAGSTVIELKVAVDMTPESAWSELQDRVSSGIS